MKQQLLRLYVPIAFVALLIVSAVWSLRQAAPNNPLEGHDQIVLVVSRTESASAAKLVMFEREGDTWRYHDTGPAVIGKNGMAWGRGLHDTRVFSDEVVKQEGDGCSPKGVFKLTAAYGYRTPGLERILLPYTQITPDMICIDDVRSEYYNMIVKSDSVGIDPGNAPSHEDMLRDDDLYRYLILVEHNTDNTEPGAGSCIFIHLWAGEDSYTAGCTAVSESTMLSLLAWLDLRKSPVLVQLTRTSYRRLKEEWGLPDVTI